MGTCQNCCPNNSNDVAKKKNHLNDSSLSINKDTIHYENGDKIFNIGTEKGIKVLDKFSQPNESPLVPDNSVWIEK